MHNISKIIIHKHNLSIYINNFELLATLWY